MAKARRKSTYPDTVKAGIPRLDALPNGWVRSTLEPYLVETKRSVKMDDNKPYDLVTVKRARGGVTKRETRLGRDISVKTQFEIQEDDFLISKRQIVHGACGVVPKHLHGSTVSNEYSVLCANDKIDMQFLKYLSHSQHFQRTCFHSSIGVHIEKMIFKLDQWFKWKFDMPPLSEQRRIAEILRTWDRAIVVTEALIAKSEAQKKALMQQLLTGKRRLPEFEGEWREVRFKDLVNIAIGGTPSRKNLSYWDDNKVTDNRWVSIRDLKEEYISKTKEHLSDEGIQNSNVKLIPRGTVVMSFKLTIGKAAILEAPCYTNEAIAAFTAKDKNKLDRDFFFQALAVVNFDAEIDQAIKGKTLNKAKLARLKMKIPALKEQKAIAAILTNSANVVASERTKLQALKTEKAALIQQLLTGKRRVKLTEAAA